MNTAPRVFRRLAVTLLSVVAAAGTAQADPFIDFLSRVGDSISRAGQHQPQKPIKTAANKKTRGKTATPETSPQPQVQAAAPGPTNTAQNIPAPAPTAAPIMVRIASVVTNADGKRRDLPYGVPVPNRAGFVTSPYAPNQGLVDVHGIASGTEVRDPFTGKIFLTP
ncbi:MAG: hypothetical protein ACJ8KU_06360 [Chthoniobacterales bacterium]